MALQGLFLPPGAEVFGAAPIPIPARMQNLGVGARQLGYCVKASSLSGKNCKINKCFIMTTCLRCKCQNSKYLLVKFHPSLNSVRVKSRSYSLWESFTSRVFTDSTNCIILLNLFLTMSVVVMRCWRSYYKEQWAIIVAEEDCVNHGRTTPRNGQASRCRHCRTLQMTEVDVQSSQQVHLLEYPQQRTGVTGIS